MPDATLIQMAKLVDFFTPHCVDRTTLDELRAMIGNEASWPEAKALFSRLRRKRQPAEERCDDRAISQYCFEELCAKTLFSLSATDMPFDADSRYLVVPSALYFARALGIREPEVTRIVAP